MHKITAFLAILEQNDLFALPDSIGEDRQDAGVRVVQRLAFSINILQAENQEGNAERVGCDPDQIFLGQLGGGIDRCWAGPGGLRGGYRVNGAATTGAKRFPLARLQAAQAAHQGVDQTAAGALVGAFPINGAGGGQQQVL